MTLVHNKRLKYLLFIYSLIIHITDQTSLSSLINKSSEENRKNLHLFIELNDDVDNLQDPNVFSNDNRTENSKRKHNKIKTGSELIQSIFKLDGNFEFNEDDKDLYNTEVKDGYLYNSVPPDVIRSYFGDNEECILGSAENYLGWWLNSNGTLSIEKLRSMKNNFLDVSFLFQNESYFNEFLQNLVDNYDIRFISVANNYMNKVPTRFLSFFGESVQFLSLAGNYFENSDSNGSITWATFPTLSNLRELDLRSCSISFIENNSFAETPNLLKLYLSGNKITNLLPESFIDLRKLAHLDLSYNFIIKKNGVDVLGTFVHGLLLDTNTFKGLKSLHILDLSYSKLLSDSVRAFTNLPPLLNSLSLCHTNFPLLIRGMFKKTDLTVLDMSGNKLISPTLSADIFEGIEKKLKILVMISSNVKSLDWLRGLERLVLLNLKKNIVNGLTNKILSKLKYLQILDLSWNQISNWYHRVFQTNTNLLYINLRENNINLMTTEMMNDFSSLKFLSIGRNNFICNCVLKEFIDMAAKNSCNFECTVTKKIRKDDSEAEDLILADDDYNYETGYHDGENFVRYDLNRSRVPTQRDMYQLLERIYSNYFLDSKTNYNALLTDEDGEERAMQNRNVKFLFKTDNIEIICNRTETIKNCTIDSNMDHDANLDFTYQLLDFERKDYKCIDSKTNTGFYFEELERCFSESNWTGTERLATQKILLIVIVSVVLFIFSIYLVCFYKWWYIRYFFVLIKNATILSFLDKEKDLLRENLSNEQNYVYDVFVSYCDENRDWILDEFLPNIENNDQLNVCLHERDFQVGLSIIENIISCMDRSRALLLVVSENFLLSHWCQFEMHLAQYRLLETRREHLIIVLLQDIPRRKRPKTLHYLMQIKTYIKWPTGDGNTPFLADGDGGKNVPDKLLADERKLFWKRLRKALTNSCSATKVNFKRNSVSNV